MLFLTTTTDLYLLLEECVCESPEDIQHGYIWAGSRNSIDGGVTVRRGLCGRTQAVQQHRGYTHTQTLFKGARRTPQLLGNLFQGCSMTVDIR